MGGFGHCKWLVRDDRSSDQRGLRKISEDSITLCPAWYSSIRFPSSVLLATLLSNLRYFDLSIHPVRQAPGQRKTTAPRRHCTHWDSVGGEKGGQGAAIMRLRRSAQEVEESDKRPTVSGQ